MQDQSAEAQDYMIRRGLVPDTPFQRWLGAKGACTSSRQSVGNQTPQQAWKEWYSLDDMKWLMFHLPQLRRYVQGCGCCFSVGAFAAEIPYSADELRQTLPELPAEVLAELGYPGPIPGAEVTIYHAVMRDETITFLDRETRDEWLAKAINVTIVVCESKVTSQTYQAMLHWHMAGEVSK